MSNGNRDVFRGKVERKMYEAINKNSPQNDPNVDVESSPKALICLKM